MLVIIGLYFAVVYLIFFRFKLIPLNTVTRTVIIVLGVYIFLVAITELRTKTPKSTQATVTAYIVDIAPQVSGRVNEVVAVRNEPVQAGDVLFTIDPTLYQSQVDALEASLALAKLREEQFQDLADADAGSRFQYQQAVAEAQGLEAQLAGARFNLENCTVRAPTDGLVPRLFLTDGQQVSPGRAVMTFMRTDEIVLTGLFQQVALQNVEVGDVAIVSFPALPGRLFQSEVVFIPEAIGEGQTMATGQLRSVGTFQGTRLYPIAVAMPDDAPPQMHKAGATALVYIHAKDAGAISGVAKALQWVSSSMSLLL